MTARTSSVSQFVAESQYSPGKVVRAKLFRGDERVADEVLGPLVEETELNELSI